VLTLNIKKSSGVLVQEFSCQGRRSGVGEFVEEKTQLSI